MAVFIPGIYSGHGKGYRGNVELLLTLSETRIERVQITSHNEVRGIAWGLNNTPIECYPKQIVEYQSLNLPLIVGAEVTCRAILSATEAALKSAGVGMEELEKLKTQGGPAILQSENEERVVDILVCGAGAGGLAAAIEAKLAGAEVLVVEKQGISGGSTARSGGKLLGAGTKWQKDRGIHDSPESVYQYLIDVGNRRKNYMDASKTRYLVDHLNDTLCWLESLTAEICGDEEEILQQPWQELSKPVKNSEGKLVTHFTVQDVEAIHESLQPWRVHNSPGGGGQTNGEGGEISAPLTLFYENNLRGEIQYNTALRELLTDENGSVVGAVCQRASGEQLTIHTRRGVVLATGGYARNEEMVNRYPVKGYFSNAPKGNIGDGLIAAEKIGAYNFEHPAVQVVYTSLTCGIGINNESGLIVNDKGERVVNEWSYQYTVSDAIAKSGSNVGWYITSGKEPYPGVQFGYKMAINGKSKDPSAKSIEDLAKKIGCDPKTFKATWERYMEMVETGEDEDFGKPACFLHPINGPRFVALRMHPCVTVTFGGLETDLAARVLRKDGRIIPGLYAAGEVAGTGMYGTQYPTCGTSIGGALFFGRIAGRMLSDQAML